MDIQVEKYDHTTVIAIDGQLNATTTTQIQDQVLASARDGRILLDMSGVTYLSSAGLRMLLLLYRRIHETHGLMALAGLSEEVSDVMSITGFLDLFTVYNSRHDGLTAFKKAG